MSARQPFLPSRPASRALNPGEDAGAARIASSNLSSDANDSAEFGKTPHTLNISSFKKSAPRTTSFGAASADFETAQNQNQNSSHNINGGLRSAAKGTAGRIYAPNPSIPSVVPAFDFKRPSLPAPLARSAAEEGPRGPNNLNNAHTSPPADLVRPKSVRPPGSESSGGRRVASEQSFFGNANFGFDAPSAVGGGELDDSGYFSGHADAPEAADRFGSPKRNDSAHANMDTRFVHSTKRGRPASPGNDQDRDVAMQQQSNRSRDSDPTKRVRRSPSRSRAPLSRASSMLENAQNEGAPAFTLPPHIPHPTAALGGLPGLEFTEADLARYAELYEQGSERWSKATTEEWMAGADEIMAKFGEMIDLIKDHMSSKMNLYKSLDTRLSDEQSALEHRAKELRDASQTLVRDSGAMGGAFH